MAEQPTYQPTFTPDRHCKLEWSRLAQAAYSSERNALGHKFSGAASMRDGTSIALAAYDELMNVYRAWLVFGWADVDRLTAGPTDVDRVTEYGLTQRLSRSVRVF